MRLAFDIETDGLLDQLTKLLLGRSLQSGHELPH